ncbi:hypothetical protein K457DRAFT_143163 [Linnemannia elongata AG-77]|uniref:Uncharacterized protein n=1 Tax=Linnemannia elongata AG-77 TaxID=1314771 RepID=A0A197JEJ8_9FUNG|nr:hypothetical protein K457DRAFT_143163 [Linnemannia elongata AG-77]
MTVLESFFRNDLLISFLRQYLRAEDVYACTLVCKQWHDQFEPYIWSTVELTHPAMIKNHSFPRPLRAAFSTHGDKIKALLTDDSANPSKIAEHCHNLTEFCAVTDRYSVENKDQESDAILKILDLNPKLTRLRLEGLQFSEGDLGSGLAVALTSLEHLAFFTLICAKECTISIANLQLILASCPINLQELTLSIPSPPPKEEAPNTNNNNNAAANNDNANDVDAEANLNGVAAAAAEATAAAAVAAAAVVDPPNPSLERLLNLQKEIEISTRNPMPFLKTLWFQGDFRDDDKPLLIPFIARCSNLETLIVPMVLEEPSDVLATTIRKYCPKLRNLEIGPTNFSDEYVAGLISSAARLEQLTLHHIPHLQASSAIAIAQHADSLQRLVLDYDTRIQSVDIQTILTSCKALQVFQIRVDNISHKSPRLEIKDLVSAPWTALKLRELELVIGSDFGDQDDIAVTVEGEVSMDESDSSTISSSDSSNVATTSGDTTITATTSEDATIVTATTSSDIASTASTSADSSILSTSTATVSTTNAEESKEKQECKDEDVKDLEMTIKNLKIQEEVLPVAKVIVPPVATKIVVDRAAMVEQVYKQLGSLTQLYSLTLGWVPVASSATTTTTTTTDTAESTATPTTSSSTSPSQNSTETAALDFTLASGLGHLKTMTRLAELDLSLMLQHKVGQEEIQWMYETWPRWYLFYGYVPRESTFEPYKFVRDAGSQEGMEHIRWLMEKRPDMKLR